MILEKIFVIGALKKKRGGELANYHCENLRIYCGRKFKPISGEECSRLDQSSVWLYYEKTVCRCCKSLWFINKIRFPIGENTDFVQTWVWRKQPDIVEKKCIPLDDRNGESLTFTTQREPQLCSCGRFKLALFLIKFSVCWYTGPIVRYERPSKVVIVKFFIQKKFFWGGFWWNSFCMGFLRTFVRNLIILFG